MLKLLIITIAHLALVFTSLAACATSKEEWEEYSNVGAYGLAYLAIATPTFKGDWQALMEFSLSAALTKGIIGIGKDRIYAKRPDDRDSNSFPSSHAGLAFSAATALHKQYGPNYGVPAIFVATLASISRVKAEQHYYEDVIAGALIGSVISWNLTTNQNDSIRFQPVMGERRVGISVTILW